MMEIPYRHTDSVGDSDVEDFVADMGKLKRLIRAIADDESEEERFADNDTRRIRYETGRDGNLIGGIIANKRRAFGSKAQDGAMNEQTDDLQYLLHCLA